MSEWRTIDSVPKDGTVVLLANPALPPALVTGNYDLSNEWGPITIGAWCTQGTHDEWVQVDAETKKLKRKEVGEWVGPMKNPTHWMPLPPPPESTT